MILVVLSDLQTLLAVKPVSTQVQYDTIDNKIGKNMLEPMVFSAFTYTMEMKSSTMKIKTI